MRPRRLLPLAALLVAGALRGQRPPAPRPGLWDAHAHLTLYGPAALDSLRAHGVVGVRDCGGDAALLRRWRDEIRAGRRRGPEIAFAGPVVDGPKDAPFRLTVRSPADARRAVDSLAALGVDFVKTHSGLSREAYFAVLREARRRGLRVASHLPRTVAAWEAADSGAASIEHAAESLLPSPIAAGYARTVDEAVAWWESPAGDSAVARLARTGTAFTPTLARYAALVDRPPNAGDRAARRRLLPVLQRLTRRLHRAGVPILAGSDFATPDSPLVPGRLLRDEIRLLEASGLSAADARAAASTNVVAWLRGRRPP